ncbi:hypothetical protein [Halomonas sp. Mc5H-6]|uniref:hypothetical protein n=1 Tax=Halomonas sp. Mc5H-6 TaxID=2954500 RepID=UPI0020973431|nr:hypothetical protein [Halomonas sp. Mc5H-6]MCO7247212.1 hypothetical protein [Halomonas sp. Mc5H-6]
MLEIPAWFISFCTALLAAFLGSMLAIWKFKKEKVWQEKYQAYQDILSALEAMVLWANETYCRQKMIPTKGTQAIEGGNWPSFSEARRVIAKTTCIGSLLLPEKVIEELVALEGDLWNENFRADEERFYYPNTFEESEAIAEHAENVEKLVKPRLKAVIGYAKKDLS